MMEPTLHVRFSVIAYDSGGYGDDRSRDFTSGEEAIVYAKGLERNFSPVVVKRITMDPMTIVIWDRSTGGAS